MFSNVKNDDYKQFKKQIILMGRDYISKEIRKVDRSYLDQFKRDLTARGEGNIPSPYLETILSAMYIDNPRDEILDGYVTKFSSLTIKNRRA